METAELAEPEGAERGQGAGQRRRSTCSGGRRGLKLSGPCRAVFGAVPRCQHDRQSRRAERAKTRRADCLPVNGVALAAVNVPFRRHRGPLLQLDVGVAGHEVSRGNLPGRRISRRRLGWLGRDRGPACFGHILPAGADDEAAAGVGHGLQCGRSHLADIGLEQLLGAGRHQLCRGGNGLRSSGRHWRGFSRRSSHRCHEYEHGRGPGPVEFIHARLQLGAAAFDADRAVPQADPQIAGEFPQGWNGVGGGPGQLASGVELLERHAQVALDRLRESGVADCRRTAGDDTAVAPAAVVASTGAAGLAVADGEAAGEAVGPASGNPLSASAGTA